MVFEGLTSVSLFSVFISPATDPPARFSISTAVTIKIVVLWVMTPWVLEDGGSSFQQMLILPTGLCGIIQKTTV